MRMLAEPKLIPSFRVWLDQQPLEQKRAILRSEHVFLASRRIEHAKQGYAGDPLEQAYEESLQGYAEANFQGGLDGSFYL